MPVPTNHGSAGDDQPTEQTGVSLRRTRELLRLSQARMARDMNLPLRWVQDLEQGRNGMTAPVRLLVKTLELFPEAVKIAARVIRHEDEGAGADG